jgi:hypothetical protein
VHTKLTEIYNYGYRTPRFPADFSFLLQTDDRLPKLLEAHCSDISEEGLAAETNAHLEVDARVTLILTLPGNVSSIRIAGKVINRREGGYGFAFVFSCQKERDHVCDYLESLRPTL